jgi:hypothetical protein
MCVNIQRNVGGALYTGIKLMPPSRYLFQFNFTNSSDYEIITKEEVTLALYLQDSGLEFYISYKNLLNDAYLPSSQEEKDKLKLNYHNYFKEIAYYLTHIPQKFSKMITDQHILYLNRVNKIIQNLEEC